MDDRRRGAAESRREDGQPRARGGTSAGAITAALIAAIQAAGKPLAHLKDCVESVDYKKFKEESTLGGSPARSVISNT